MEAIIFAMNILANPVLPHGGLRFVHLMSSRRPVNHQVTATSPSVCPVISMLDRIHTAMCHLVIGPYCTDAMCHPLSDATCRVLVGPYTYHVILSVPYECHVSPCQWFHIIMFVQYGFHVSPCQWCHVAPPFCQICLFHQYNRTR